MLRALCLTLALLAPPALATTQGDVLMAEILPGWQTEAGGQMAALRLTLAPGWKTYWRSPGDAGIPPRLDWSGSVNVAAIRLHWPAPQVFHTNGLTTIGYHDALVLPVEVTLKDPAQPARLALHVELGVCEDICIPAEVAVAADLARPGAADPAIRAALAARPHNAAEAGLGAHGCTLEPIKDGLRITAMLALPRQGGEETVAFELADGEVWVAEATAERKGATLTAWTDLVPPEAAPFALDRGDITITVISDRGAVEIRGCPAP